MTCYYLINWLVNIVKSKFNILSWCGQTDMLDFFFNRKANTLKIQMKCLFSTQKQRINSTGHWFGKKLVFKRIWNS